MKTNGDENQDKYEDEYEERDLNEYDDDVESDKYEDIK